MTDLEQQSTLPELKPCPFCGEPLQVYPQEEIAQHNSDQRCVFNDYVDIADPDDVRHWNTRVTDLDHDAKVRREVYKAADTLGYHCTGCGHLCGDPKKDLSMIRMAGGLSCCSERKMEPLSDTIRALLNKEGER